MISDKSSEFQVIIAIDFDDGRLFPLTENLPQCLLPIGNETLLRIQLNVLEKFGATDVLIVSPEDYKTQIASSLADYSSDVMKVELVPVVGDDFQGTADCLRFISKRIRGDFIFLSSDVVCQFNMGDLITYHRTNAADVTIGMIGCRIDEPEKKGGAKKIHVEEDEQEFTSLSTNGRLIMRASVAEVEKVLRVHKSYLHKNDGKLKLRTDLVDSGLYVFSRWVIDLLQENPNISSVRSELIPFLIERQFQTREFLQAHMPGIKQGKFRGAKGIDKWLSAQEALPRHRQQLYLQATVESEEGGNCDAVSPPTAMAHSKSSLRTKELCDYILEELSLAGTISQMNSAGNLADSGPCGDMIGSGAGSPVQSKRKGSNLSAEDIREFDSNRSRTTSNFGGDEGVGACEGGGDDGEEADFIRCFCYVCEHSSGHSGGLLQRVSSATSYLALNRDMPLQQGPFAAKFSNYQKKEQTVTGDGLEMGDKVTIKQSSVGKKCVIGAKSKLNNCILMDNVRVGENCTIQNTILSAGVVVETNCNLNDCQVASGVVVAAGTKLKGEGISGSI